MNFVNKVIPLQEQQAPSVVERWPLRQSLQIDATTAAGPAPTGWRDVAAGPLVVLVGLTGAGKTTLARALANAGLVDCLPDRRVLTDEVILGDDASILDRAGRFAATAAFRRTAPGGMGEVLASLSVSASRSGPLLFDGLRGEGELAFFAPKALRSVFIALRVADETRAHRIASRGDRFDRSASGDVARARALVVEESSHYSLGAALQALKTHAEGRFHVLDAERKNPAQIAADASKIIRAAFY